MLYPLKLAPRVKKPLWGSESWVLSAVEGDVSIVKGGMLDGNPLDELVGVYMGDLVGDKVFERFGEEFPLLVKIIDARQKLSVQVHPTDDIAAARHGAWGKTEMWYILHREPGAKVYLGFREGVTREVYSAALADGSVDRLLNEVDVEPGDAFFIPSGTVHTIGEGVTLAEVQQTSDVTYRIFDWNRLGLDGRPRELHTEWAMDAINFAAPVRRISQRPPVGEAALLVESPYFTANVVDVAGAAVRELASRDSFTIYICLAGEVSLSVPGSEATLKADEAILIPADQNEITLTGNATLLETYI